MTNSVTDATSAQTGSAATTKAKAQQLRSFRPAAKRTDEKAAAQAEAAVNNYHALYEGARLDCEKLSAKNRDLTEQVDKLTQALKSRVIPNTSATTNSEKVKPFDPEPILEAKFEELQKRLADVEPTLKALSQLGKDINSLRNEAQVTYKASGGYTTDVLIAAQGKTREEIAAEIKKLDAQIASANKDAAVTELTQSRQKLQALLDSGKDIPGFVPSFFEHKARYDELYPEVQLRIKNLEALIAELNALNSANKKLMPEIQSNFSKVDTGVKEATHERLKQPVMALLEGYKVSEQEKVRFEACLKSFLDDASRKLNAVKDDHLVPLNSLKKYQDRLFKAKTPGSNEPPSFLESCTNTLNRLTAEQNQTVVRFENAVLEIQKVQSVIERLWTVANATKRVSFSEVPQKHEAKKAEEPKLEPVESKAAPAAASTSDDESESEGVKK